MTQSDSPVVLIGFMAAGKTAVGRRLAPLLGREFLDLDTLISAAQGRPPADLIRDRGEAWFRRVESQALVQALDTRNTVVATGGGTVLTPRNRRAMARIGCRTIWLRVSAAEAWDRVRDSEGAGAERPLLPRTVGEVGNLLAAREACYAEAATETVVTDGRTPEQVAAALAEAWRRPRPAPGRAGTVPAFDPETAAGSRDQAPAPEVAILTGGPKGHGPVVVGHGLLDRFARLPGFPEGIFGPVFLTGDPLAMSLFGERVRQSLGSAGHKTVAYVLPTGERAKTVSSLRRLWEAMAAGGLGRGGIVISLGGGAASDVAGFAAASFMRGVRVVHLPTTLLAQVDAAVGGKTAVNLRQGKNLAGSFHFPSLVVADVAVCRTLPQALVAEGMVELAKTLLVTQAPVEELRAAVAGIAGRSDAGGGGPGTSAVADGSEFAGLVARSVQAKLGVTRADPADQGVRMTLNLGHTFGHAIEAEAGYGRVRHGLAVGAGLLAAARLSERTGRLPEPLAAGVSELVRDLLALFPNESRKALGAVNPDRTLERLAYDKKKVGSEIVYVLLEAGEGGWVKAAVTREVSPVAAGEALAWALAVASRAAERRRRRP